MKKKDPITGIMEMTGCDEKTARKRKAEVDKLNNMFKSAKKLGKLSDKLAHKIAINYADQPKAYIADLATDGDIDCQKWMAYNLYGLFAIKQLFYPRIADVQSYRVRDLIDPKKTIKLTVSILKDILPEWLPKKHKDKILHQAEIEIEKSMVG